MPEKEVKKLCEHDFQVTGTNSEGGETVVCKKCEAVFSDSKTAPKKS